MIDSLVARYLDERRLTAPSLHAWRVIRCHLRILLEFLETEEIGSPSEFTPDLMARFQTALFYRTTRYGKPAGPGFQIGVLGTLRGLVRYLLRNGFLLLDPTTSLENPRPRQRLPTGGLSQAEVERLLAAPDTNTPLGCRDRAMLEVLYATGIRAGELLALKLSDFGPDDAILRIRAGKNKKDRVVPLGPAALEWCGRYLATVRPLFPSAAVSTVLFLSHKGKPLNNTVLNLHLDDYGKKAGLTRRLSAHALRHTCATLMLKAGCDIRYIQALLGHANLSTTEIYTKVEIGDLARAHARFHPRSFSRGEPKPMTERFTRGRNPWRFRPKKHDR